VTSPPVVQPPVENLPPVFRPALADPAAAQRTVALVDRQLAEGRAAQQARSAFVAAAAERRAAATVAQGHAALAILQSTETDMAAFQSRWLGRDAYAGRPATA
jgi:CubicO group peptidase (beta-lactamase class C family)